MRVRTGLPHQHKTQSPRCTGCLFAGKVARQFHVPCANNTGSCRKCNRIGHCRCSWFSSNPHCTRSPIMANSWSSVSPRVAISGRGKRLPTHCRPARIRRQALFFMGANYNYLENSPTQRLVSLAGLAQTAISFASSVSPQTPVLEFAAPRRTSAANAQGCSRRPPTEPGERRKSVLERASAGMAP